MLDLWYDHAGKVISCLAAICLFLLLHFLGEIPALGAFILTVLFLLVELQMASSEKEMARKRFCPFRVDLSPKFDVICNDLGLVPEGQTFEQIELRAKSRPESEFSLLRSGLSFSVLESNLIFFNGLQSFSTELRFRTEITEIRLPPPFPRVMDEFVPSFQLKGGGNGYELGVSTPESYRQKLDEGTWSDKEFVLLATIPYEEFGLYYMGEAPGLMWSMKANERWWKLGRSYKEGRDEKAASAGWKRTKIGDRATFPEWIDHKYFALQHRSI